jgi:hypothetical protein
MLVGPQRIGRVVGREEFAITTQALKRARWRCEVCGHDSDLRVIEDSSSRFWVMCSPCRRRVAWARTANRERPSRPGSRSAKGDDAAPLSERDGLSETENPSSDDGNRDSATRIRSEDEPEEGSG